MLLIISCATTRFQQFDTDARLEPVSVPLSLFSTIAQVGAEIK